MEGENLGMKRGFLKAVPVLVLFPGLLLGGFSCGSTDADPHKTSRGINCDIQRQACTREVSGVELTLDIYPKPVKAMKYLVFQVRLSGAVPSGPPYIDLGMPGMDMGPNRVPLKAVQPGIYEGRGVIVRCPSGHTLWRATVTIPGSVATDFVFDVVY